MCLYNIIFILICVNVYISIYVFPPIPFAAGCLDEYVLVPLRSCHLSRSVARDSSAFLIGFEGEKETIGKRTTRKETKQERQS